MKADSVFFIVGGQRCGTTWLYRQLECHPKICMARPVRPEPKYFINHEGPVLAESYLNAHFGHRTDEKLFGEKSTSYYESAAAAELICSTFNHAKIIFLLRHPVQRVCSNFRFSVSNGLETRSAEEVFIENLPPPNVAGVSVNPFNYIGRSNYLPAIKRYISCFGRKQVGIFLFENVVSSFSGIEQILYFLEQKEDKLFKQRIEEQLQIKENQSKIDYAFSERVLTEIESKTTPFVDELKQFIPDVDFGIWDGKPR